MFVRHAQNAGKKGKNMNLDVLNEVKNRDISKELNNELEVKNLNDNMDDLGEKLQDYLKNNKEPNRNEKRFDLPIDFDLETGKNELGDTTILGKITIEKSAMKDFEKIQDKAEDIRDKTVSSVKKGLGKVYDVIKNTVIEKVAEKVLGAGSKVLKVATKVVGSVGSKILKI